VRYLRGASRPDAGRRHVAVTRQKHRGRVQELLAEGAAAVAVAVDDAADHFDLVLDNVGGRALAAAAQPCPVGDVLAAGRLAAPIGLHTIGDQTNDALADGKVNSKAALRPIVGLPMSAFRVGGRLALVKQGIVLRPALLGRLDSPARVAVVSGRAGSGKTFLLQSWIAVAGRAECAAWVPVQRDEHDEQRFWLQVASALRGTALGAALVRGVTAAPDLDGWTIAERLLADLASLQDPLWLVLDDLHELASDQALRQLELVILRAPPTLATPATTALPC
jgi:hypothetical protein